MNIYKVGITKKDLSHVPEKEQILLFQGGTMLNEINILHKITYFCKGVKSFFDKTFLM